MNVLPDLRDQLVNAVTLTEPVQATNSKPRARRRFVAPLIALGALAVAGTSATALIVDHQRQQSSTLTQQPAQRGDAGSVVHYGAELVAVAQRIQENVPYPDGRTDDFDWATYRPDPGAPAEYEGSLRAFIEFRASCIWRREWVDATKAADERRAADAVAILSEVPTWPGFRGDRGTGPERARAVAALARGGDVSGVENTLGTDCHGF